MSVDVRSRRRLVIDLSTTVDVFTSSPGNGQSDGIQSGAEPSVGEADEGNGGNAFPFASGSPESADRSVEIVCRRGGALSATRAEGGAQQRWRYSDEGSQMWRGASFEETHRAGYTTEVVKQRVYDGDAGRGKYTYGDAVVTPEGRIIVAAQRTTGSSPFYGREVDILWKDRGATSWNVVEGIQQDQYGSSVQRCPRIVRRPDGLLICYYIVVRASGAAATFAGSFSADEGETWGILMQEAAADLNFNLTVDRLSVVYANGYFVALMNQPGTMSWHYSVDGGVSFRSIDYYGMSPSESFASISVLIDETLLLAYATTDSPATVDSVRVCRVAAGLDIPDTLADYTEVDTFALGSVLDVIQWRGYDGSPFLAICVSGTPAVWQVYRGSMDGTSWTAVATSDGLFTPWTGGTQIQTIPGSLQVIPHEGTFAVLWSNDGVSSGAVSSVYEGSLNWTPAAGAENVSCVWKWQWCWTMAAGDPNGAAEGVSRVVGGAGATVTLSDAPRRLTVVGGPGGRVSWTSSAGTRTNSSRLGVATGVYRVVAGCGKYTGKCVLDVTGSDGAASARAIARLGAGNWGLADSTGTTIAEGDHDFSGGLWEVLLAVRGGATSIDYALRIRPWGSADRVWTVLAVGTHSVAAGVSAVGAVVWGSTQDLPSSADSYELMIGSFTLDQATADLSDGSGAGIFGTGTSAVTMGQVMGTLPVPLAEGLYVSWSGDVCSQGDGFSLSSRWQYALENLAPGRRGTWRSETDGVEHYFTLDYAPGSVLTVRAVPVGPWTELVWWGTNFRTATVRLSNDSSFATYDEYALDAAVYEGVGTGALAFGVLTEVSNVRVAGAGWETNRWVGYIFRWESGIKTGLAGRVVSNTDEVLVVEADDTWTSAEATGNSFVLYSDRMFYSSESPVAPKRYARWIIPAQGTPEGYYRGSGIMKGPSHSFHANWEWEAEERLSPLIETVESPGGQRYVYNVSAPGIPRREIDLEWTGVKDGARQGLLGAWRAAGGSTRVVALIVDTRGGPDAVIPARVVGDFKHKTAALYVQAAEGSAPVLQVVDLDALTVSEELK